MKGIHAERDRRLDAFSSRLSSETQRRRFPSSRRSVIHPLSLQWAPPQRGLYSPSDVSGKRPVWELIQVKERHPPCSGGQHHRSHAYKLHPYACFHLQNGRGKNGEMRKTNLNPSSYVKQSWLIILLQPLDDAGAKKKVVTVYA